MGKILAPASRPQELFLTLRDGTGKRSRYATDEGEEVDIIFYGGQAGGGKALLHGEKVLTPSGFVNIEDSYEGMEIISPDNSMQTVTNVYPQGEVDIYEVLFEDGRSVKCCGEHLWEIRDVGGKLVQNTLQIKEYVDRQKNREEGKNLPVVDNPFPLDFRSTDLSLLVDPYRLGAFLCDGVLIDGVENGLAKYGLYSEHREDKFIPADYLKSSVEDRFCLLQGLMDTGGYISPDGEVYFYSVSETLVDNVREVLHGLGFTVTTYKRDVGCDEDNEHCLYIQGIDCDKLFRASSKKSRVVSEDVGVRIDSISYVGRGEATCISVTGSRLFVTTGYIVTHNSFASLLHHIKYCHLPNYKGVTIRRTTPMLTKPGAIWDEARSLYRDFDPTARIRLKDMKISLGPVKDIDRRAEVSFTHFERVDDTVNFQGSQLSSVVMDYNGPFIQ